MHAHAHGHAETHTQVLDLATTNIGDAEVVAVAACHMLRSLDLSHCTQLTGNALQPLNGHGMLHELLLAGLTDLTDVQISLPSLTVLDLTGDRFVDGAAVARLVGGDRRRRPMVRKLLLAECDLGNDFCAGQARIGPSLEVATHYPTEYVPYYPAEYVPYYPAEYVPRRSASPDRYVERHGSLPLLFSTVSQAQALQQRMV